MEKGTPLLRSQIDATSRMRQADDYGDIEGLAGSLKRRGSIQPIVLARDGEKFYLVAGGRRWKAFDLLKVDTLYYGSTLNPEKFGFVFEDDVPLHARKEAELDENIWRLGMSWQTEVLGVAEIHAEKRKANFNDWGLEQTAKILGDGYNKTSVGYSVKVAKLLRDGDAEIKACPNFKAAWSLLLKRKEDEALRVLAAKVNPAAAVAKAGLGGTETFLERINTTMSLPDPVRPPPLPGAQPSPSSPEDAAMALINKTSATVSPPADGQQPGPVAPGSPPVLIPLSRMFHLGDSIRDIMPNAPDECFDHIVTDIPYGIDMANLEGVKNIDSVEAEHDVQENLALMPRFLVQAFRLIKPQGFCVFFYDLDHHEKLQNWAKVAGFTGIQRWPRIWHKTHTCKNDAAAYNSTKDYEVCMILRKDSKTTLRKPWTSSVSTLDGAVARKIHNNPFAKPFELWKDIYDHIAFQGQTVYDPYCGEMSACMAAAQCGLIPFGSEKKEIHFNRGLEHMRETYKQIHRNNVNFE